MKKIIAIVLSIIMSCPYAFAADVGKVTYVEGRVDVQSANSDMAVPVREGDTISIGDAVRTKSNSKAEITFDDKSIARLAQNTRVEIKDYTLDENNKRKNANLALDRGKIRTIIAKMPAPADFVISTPNAKGTVRGSDIFTFYQAGNSGMLVADGKLSVVNTAHPENSIIIPTGNSVLVPLEELPKGPRAYFDLEKKLHEQDTSVPITKRERDTIIRGAITKASGKVSITTKGAAAPHDASINDILDEGDKIETGDNGLVEIKFDNGNAINLKPGTNLTIKRLVTLDLATGEYENTFESTQGAIRARIENLKGKSKFEIRTPAAVSGARGTIMYSIILQNKIKAYFEGGDGYIYDLISGITRIIGAGQNAATDGTGNISEPQYTPEDEREATGEGWDPGSGTEGYSAPEGTTGSYLYGNDTGTGAGGAGFELPPSEGGAAGESFDDFPITESGATTTTTTGESQTTGPLNNPITLILNAKFGEIPDYEMPFSPDPDSTISAAITSETTEAPWEGLLIDTEVPDVKYSEATIAEGTYSNPGQRTLWLGDVTGTGADGGIIQGWMAGLWNTWGGIVNALYLDPSGNAGIMLGQISGEAADNAFSGDGNIFIIPMVPEPISPTTPIIEDSSTENIYFENDEVYFDSYIARNTLNFEGERWGILLDAHAADYYRPDNPTPNTPDGRYEWSGVDGGEQGNDGYFITTAKGIDDLNNDLRMNITFTSLDETTLSTWSEIILGTYSDEGGYYYFQGLGLGAYVEKMPLLFNGELGARIDAYGGFGGYDEGLNLDNGIISARLGGTESLWEGSPRVIIMGDFYNDYNDKLWGTDLKGATTDGATFVGTVGGTDVDNRLKALMLLLYIRPDPANPGGYLAGYVTSSDIEGNSYPEIDMFRAFGSLNHYLNIPTTISPQELYDEMNNEGGYNLIEAGDFHGDISGDASGTIDGEAINLIDQDWGLWRAGTGGIFNMPLPSDSWEATISGFGEDESGKVTDALIGIVTGNNSTDNTLSANAFGLSIDYDNFLIFSGEFIGTHNSDTWQALGGGAWLDVELFKTLRTTEQLPPLFNNLELAEITGRGLGSFTQGPGGVLEVEEFSGVTLNASGRSQGVWGGVAEGVYSGQTNNSWRLALGGESSNENSYFLGTVDGTKWSPQGILEGEFNGVWLAAGENGNIKAGIISGDVKGDYVKIEGEPGPSDDAGTWQAIGVGEWVEVTKLLDQYEMFGPEGLNALNNFVTLPVTEVSSNMLTQVNVGSIAGGFSVTNLSDFLNFDFTRWENDEWLAKYTGKTGGIDITGQAGGTFGNGEFTGVGAGLNQDILNTVAVTGDYGPDGTISNATADVTLYTNVTPPA